MKIICQDANNPDAKHSQTIATNVSPIFAETMVKLLNNYYNAPNAVDPQASSPFRFVTAVG